MSRVASKVSIASKQSTTDISHVEVAPIFPKQLPELIVGPIYDESGFTLNERLALRQAWKLIKPFERRYGKDIYFIFLMENYTTFENFRTNGKLDLQRLHGHSLAFMRFISAIIEQNDAVVFHMLLHDNYDKHNRCHVAHQHMQMLMQSLVNYVLKKLEKVNSAALESGFQRLLDKFQSFYYKQETIGVSFAAFRRSLVNTSLKNNYSIQNL